MGKQTVYRWWPSKAAVLLDAITAQSGNDEGNIELPNSGDIEADQREVLYAIVDEFNDPRYDQTMRSLIVALLEDEKLADVDNERPEIPMYEVKRSVSTVLTRAAKSTRPSTSTQLSTSSSGR